MKKIEKQVMYVERDVSWMYFNHRILQEAEKSEVPLLERLSFLGIYSNNLDEFFRVRVATLNRLADSEALPEKHRKTLKKTLKTINQLNEAYAAEYAKAIDTVFDELEQHHIRVLNETQLNDEQKQYLRMFDNEIKNAQADRPAWVKIKINHITDTDMVQKMYEASRAGVRIDALVRGNCSLVPGVAGVSDNIRIVGIIDRYLEHSRILIFCNNERPRFFIGSADWMPRNLVNRIEVMAPVYDDDMRRDLLRTVDLGLHDTTNGRLVDGHGTDAIQPVAEGENPLRSQEELHEAYAL